MLTILACIVLTLVITFFITMNEDTPERIYTLLFYSVAMGLLSWLLVSVISVDYIRKHPNEYTWHTEVVSVTYIKTLSDNITVGGSFFLGFGNITSNPKFYFYKEISDSTFYMGSINAKGVKIVETNYKRPSVIKYVKHIDWSKSELNSNWVLTSSTLETEYYELYVPKNTIILNYTLDAN